MKVESVWVDMDGLAADDACEQLLEDCILKMRARNPGASQQWVKLLSCTQIAWAGTGGKSEEDGKTAKKSKSDQS